MGLALAYTRATGCSWGDVLILGKEAPFTTGHFLRDSAMSQAVMDLRDGTQLWARQSRTSGILRGGAWVTLHSFHGCMLMLWRFAKLFFKLILSTSTPFCSIWEFVLLFFLSVFLVFLCFFLFFNDFYRSFFEVQKMISLAVSDVFNWVSFSGSSKYFFKNVYHFFPLKGKLYLVYNFQIFIYF